MALQPKWDVRPPRPARRTDNFSKSDNNTLRQILAEGKNCMIMQQFIVHYKMGSGKPWIKLSILTKSESHSQTWKSVNVS